MPFLVLIVGIIAAAFVVHQKGEELIRAVIDELRQVLHLKPTKEAVDAVAVIGMLIISIVIVIGEEAKTWFHLAKGGDNPELYILSVLAACVLVTAITLILSVKYITRK